MESRNGLQWRAATACSGEPQRPAVESRNGLQWRAATACNGEPPLCCFECVQSRNDLHNDSCQVAVLGELADRITVMACTGRFYVLGPPTQHSRDVVHVVNHVIKQKTKTFTVEDVQDPVHKRAASANGNHRSGIASHRKISSSIAASGALRTATWLLLVS